MRAAIMVVRTLGKMGKPLPSDAAGSNWLDLGAELDDLGLDEEMEAELRLGLGLWLGLGLGLGLGIGITLALALTPILTP